VWKVPAVSKTIRIVLSVVVLGGALGVALYQTVRQDTQYYKHVDEVMPAADAWYGKQLQLHGFVVDGSWRRRSNSLDHLFKIRSGAHEVEARYTGVVPDTFKDGAEVVLTGRLTPAGFDVQRDGVMAKCPSKYEASQASAAGSK
jgi:cytochrome c-type biogenesis protein CcmE